jgi:hypothetical protein
MKCTYCAADTRYKSREANGGTCESCKRKFAFEPKKDRLKLTDQKFQNALDAISDNGALKFTPDHLRYELARRQATLHWLRYSVVVMVVLFIFAIFVNSGVAIIAWIAASLPVFGLMRWLSRYRLRNAPLAHTSEFNYMQSLWVTAHGPIRGLIGKGAVMQMKEANIEPEPYYSFARVVVTDTQATAALLLVNKFHIENECAVLCIDGYPFTDWQAVVGLLRTNPDLEIALVHDASAAGCALPSRVRQSDWFPDERFVCVDVGLRPSQARALNLPVLQNPVPPPALKSLEHLSLKDLGSLEHGRHSELTSLTPKRLMTAIIRDFTRLTAARSVSSLDTASGTHPGGVWFFGNDEGNSDEETFG